MPDNVLRGTIKIDAPGVKEQFAQVEKSTDNLKKSGDKLIFSLDQLQQKLKAKKQTLISETDLGRIKVYQSEVANLEKEVGRVSKITLGGTATGIENIGAAATKGYSALRTLAYIIPGVGIGGLVAGFSDLIIQLFQGSASLDGVAKKLGIVKSEAVDSKLVISSFKDIFKDATKNVAEDSVKLEVFKQKLTDLTIPASERNKILKEYNSVADDTNKIDAAQINNLDLINQKIDAQNTLIIQRALSVAAMSKITEAANKLIENEAKLQEQLSREGFKDLDDYDKKQKEAADNRQKLFKKDPKAFEQDQDNLNRVRAGLDGVVNPALKAAKAFDTDRDALNSLVSSVKIGRAELQKLVGNLSGLITIPGLTTEKKDNGKKEKTDKVNFFDEFLSFDPKNVKADTENAVKAFDIFAKYALENQKRLIGLDEIFKIDSEKGRPAAIKAAAEWWEAYNKARKEGNVISFYKLVPSIDVKPKIKLDQKEVEKELTENLKAITNEIKGTKSPTITVKVNTELIKDYENFKSVGEKIGRSIGEGFDETFKKMFDDAFKGAIERGLSRKQLKNFKAEFAATTELAAQGISGIADSFGKFTDALLQGKSGMQAFGEALKGVFRGIAVEIVRDIVLAGILSLLSGGAANGGLSFIGALGKIIGGSHASGLRRVPKDGYIAELHKDEMVVPARQSDMLRSIMGSDFSIRMPSLPSTGFAKFNNSTYRNMGMSSIDVNVSGEFRQNGDHLVAVINKTNRQQKIAF